MSNTLAISLQAVIQWSNSFPLSLTNFVDASSLQYAETVPSGASGTFACDQIWAGQYTLTASGGGTPSVTFDLTALDYSVQGTNNLAYDMAHVRLIFLSNLNSATGDILSIASGASNGFIAPWNASAGANQIGASSMFWLSNLEDGWATSGTHKTITVANLSATDANTFNILIAGNSA